MFTTSSWVVSNPSYQRQAGGRRDQRSVGGWEVCVIKELQRGGSVWRVLTMTSAAFHVWKSDVRHDDLSVSHSQMFSGSHTSVCWTRFNMLSTSKVINTHTHTSRGSPIGSELAHWKPHFCLYFVPNLHHIHFSLNSITLWQGLIPTDMFVSLC